MARSAGKRGRAVELSANPTTQDDDGQRDNLIGNTHTVPSVVSSQQKSDIIELFSIGACKVTKKERETKPFIHQVKFKGPQGEVIRVQANIDDGAMKEVMSTTMFQKVKHRLGTTLPSTQLLRVANGAVIASEAKWKGEIEVDGVSTSVTFEVFDSGGRWDFLFGKTLLEAFKATHNYERDEISIQGIGGNTTIRNLLVVLNSLPT
jgi:hypothetical protein